ncbi:MAG TPA: hypothetical protein PK916_03490 [Bacteroidota bacterium]|nr:hypothetical protein [Bacteroidota bacterium]
MLLLLLATAGMAFAAGDLPERGARSAAMGGGGVAVGGDAWLALRNPALLAGSTAMAAVSSTPWRYGFTELSSSAAAWTHTFAFCGAALTLTRSGSPLYRETEAAVSAGTAFGAGLAIGMSARMLNVAIERYGATTVPMVDVGATADALPSLTFGIRASNVTLSSLGGVVRDRLPSLMHLGAAWRADSTVLLLVDVEKDPRWPVLVRVGGEVQVGEALLFRAGSTLAPWTASGGFAIRWQRFIVEYACQWHPDLGATHTFGIGFHP